MVGEIISAIFKMTFACARMFNNRLVILLHSQNGFLVRRRNKYAIIIGDYKNPQFTIAVSAAYANKLTIMELDNKIFDIVNNLNTYKKVMILKI